MSPSATWSVKGFSEEETPLVATPGLYSPIELTVPWVFRGEDNTKSRTIVVLSVYNLSDDIVTVRVNNSISYKLFGGGAGTIFSLGDSLSSGYGVYVSSDSDLLRCRISGIFNNVLIDLPTGGPGTTVTLTSLATAEARSTVHEDSTNELFSFYEYILPTSGGFLPPDSLDNYFGFFADYEFPATTTNYHSYNYIPSLYEAPRPRFLLSFGHLPYVCDTIDKRYNTFTFVKKVGSAYRIGYLKGTTSSGECLPATLPITLKIFGWLRKDVVDIETSSNLLEVGSPLWDSSKTTTFNYPAVPIESDIGLGFYRRAVFVPVSSEYHSLNYPLPISAIIGVTEGPSVILGSWGVPPEAYDYYLTYPYQGERNLLSGSGLSPYVVGGTE